MIKANKSKSAMLLQRAALKDLPTAVIVCNGPSLADVPNDWLAKYTTFGANRVFLKEGFTPTYLSIFDMKMVSTLSLVDEAYVALQEVEEGFVSSVVGDEFAEADKDKLDNVKVLAWKNLLDKNGKYLPVFSLNPRRVVNSGGSVTFVSMQLAWWKGFRRLLCVGLDHNFTGSRGDHFTSDYNKDVGIPYEGNKIAGTGAGKWYWDGETFYHKTAAFYQVAKAQFKGEIYNLTPGTNLNVFDKGSIEDW